MSKKPKKRLSLCLITKDEERFLPGCLGSVKDFVDEIVIADTGSTDRTIEIAKGFGAKVVPFQWCDDFAAARNAALEAATGDVILSLDADEELAHGFGKRLRRFALKESFLVGLLPLHNATSLDADRSDVISGAARRGSPTYLPRLFPNHPALRFKRRVHEQVGGDLIEARQVVGGKLRAVETPLIHWGNVPELRASRDKEKRNRELLERALSEDPTDGDLAGYLAAMRFQVADHAGVAQLGNDVLPHLFAKIDALSSLEFAPSPIQFASAVAASAIHTNNPAAARVALEGALQRIAKPHPNLLFLLGVAAELQGELSEARDLYEKCLALDGIRQTVPLNPGVTGDTTRLRLANVFLKSGHPGGALAVVEACSTQLPEKEAAIRSLLHAEILLEVERPADALVALTPWLEAGTSVPDVFALASAAADALGTPEPMFAEAARKQPNERWLEKRRASLVLDSR